MRYSLYDAAKDFAKAVMGGAAFGSALIYGATKVMAATPVFTAEGESVLTGLLSWFLFFAPWVFGFVVGWLACSLCWILGGNTKAEPLHQFEGDAP